jgi:F0F1-type ATP synthase membrane subunit c/vacuolar-type H+-ATPase subunit K
MDAEAARYLGAGIALLCFLGIGLALGNIFSSYMNAIARNPSAESKLRGIVFIGAGMTEALGLFAFAVAIVMLFS